MPAADQAKGLISPDQPAPTATVDKQEAASVKSAVATREDNLAYDLKHLAAFDISPLQPKINLLEYTRDSVQLLMNKIFALPRKSEEEGTMVQLPSDDIFRLPRQKPIPKVKVKTRWQKFMEEKNMTKQKRSSLVFDEVSGDWKRRWGRDSAKTSQEGMDWAMEVKEGEDPYANPFEQQAAEKQLQHARHKMREFRNKVEAAGGKVRASVPELNKKAHEGHRGKEGLREAIKSAQISSASIGKFDRAAPNEATNLQPKKKRHALLEQRNDSQEKDFYMKAATKILESDGNVNRSKAAKLGINQGLSDLNTRGSQDAKVQRREKKPKRRSKQGKSRKRG